MIIASRVHYFCAGHRVVGHEGKCKNLHGHEYAVHFNVVPIKSLDSIGRVLDFSVINTRLCQWLEEQWDHRMLLWDEDPLCKVLQKYDSAGIILVPFNPTAENMAIHLVEVIGPRQLKGTHCRLHSVTVEETRKCSASYSLKGEGDELSKLVY